LLLTGLAVWQNVPRRKHVKEFAKPAVPPAPYQLIVSQPLPATQLITSQPLVVPIEVAEQTLTIIRTYGGGFREVGDEELLALAAPQTAALIRRGPHEAELVFVSDPRQETEESN
jgi:hypothetical protein